MHENMKKRKQWWHEYDHWLCTICAKNSNDLRKTAEAMWNEKLAKCTILVPLLKMG